MKRLILICLLAGCCLSCSKDRCQNCTIITESSFEDADDKCQGYENSHPTFKIVSTTNVGELCGDEIEDTRARMPAPTNTQLCPGVIYTIRTRLECQ